MCLQAKEGQGCQQALVSVGSGWDSFSQPQKEPAPPRH